MRNKEEVKLKAMQLLTSGLDAEELSMCQLSVTMSAEDKRNDELKKIAYKEAAREDIDRQRLDKLKEDQEKLKVLCDYVGVPEIPSNEFMHSVARWLSDHGSITVKQEAAIKGTIERMNLLSETV